MEARHSAASHSSRSPNLNAFSLSSTNLRTDLPERYGTDYGTTAEANTSAMSKSSDHSTSIQVYRRNNDTVSSPHREGEGVDNWVRLW